MAVAKTNSEQSSQCIQDAGLSYTLDDRPGIRRLKAGKNFRFIDEHGKQVKDKVVIGRIQRLAIPPAWSGVWICPDANGHLQATGRDARGRKQYRYHVRWRETRDSVKFGRLVAFAKTLPKIRQRVDADLKRPGLSREKVLAAVVKILERGLIRIGNDEYARTNKSFGLTTMQDRHATVKGSAIHFQFRGKSGKFHQVSIEDRQLAKIVAGCQAIPGQELFQYRDDEGKARDVTSSDVNEYLRAISAEDFTAKDFRTWGGTVLAAFSLSGEKFETKTQAKKNLVRSIAMVAERLGNTPSICRKCYIHPFIMDSYLEGKLRAPTTRVRTVGASSRSALQPREVWVLGILKKHATKTARSEKSTLVEKLEASIKHRRTGR